MSRQPALVLRLQTARRSQTRGAKPFEIEYPLQQGQTSQQRSLRFYMHEKIGINTVAAQ